VNASAGRCRNTAGDGSAEDVAQNDPERELYAGRLKAKRDL
jgi:hypothetical protein